MAEEELGQIVEPCIAGQATESDQQVLSNALLTGQIDLVTGERSVTISGNATDAIIVTGNNNFIFQNGDFEAIRNVITDCVSPSSHSHASQKNTNLPRHLSSFIGREKEIAEVKRLLSVSPLVTLTGAGGCGKTRLALEAGKAVTADYVDGVYFVDLSWVAEPEMIVQSIAILLGVPEQASLSMLDSIGVHINDKQILLILDNCEHLIVDCAEIVTALLQSCPQLHIFATSRETLNIEGEMNYTVLPFAVDNLAQNLAVELLIQQNAVKLFVDRATAKKSDFVLDTTNAPSIADICKRLDGIPLAIEMAAGRINTMTAEDIAHGLKERFQLLTTGRRDAHSRHQTLWNCIDWSYTLLSPMEQILLRRLTVFVGGCQLPAAEAICGWDKAVTQIPDLLASLRDKSLILADECMGKMRFSMLQTTRKYGYLKLNEDFLEAAKIRIQHLASFSSWIKEIDKFIHGPDQQHILDSIEIEHDNFREAMSCSLAVPIMVPMGMELAATLSRYWLRRGHYWEGRTWCDRFLAHKDINAPLPLAMLLQAAGNLANAQGDTDRAYALLDESQQLFRDNGDVGSADNTLNDLGNVAWAQGDFAAVRKYWEESLASSRLEGHSANIATSLVNLGQLEQAEGNFIAALERLSESLERFESLNDDDGIAEANAGIGLVFEATGQCDLARACFQKSYAIHHKLGNQAKAAHLNIALGVLAVSEGDNESALSHYNAALSIFTELGAKIGIATSKQNIANILAAWEQYDLSRAMYRDVLILQCQTGNQLGVVSALRGLASVAFAQKHYPYAARLFAVDSSWYKVNTISLAPGVEAVYNEQIAKVRTALGNSDFEKFWNEGVTMSLDEAVEYALSHD